MVWPRTPWVPFPAMQTGDLSAAAAAVEAAGAVVQQGIATLKAAGGVDANQVVAYELAHAAAAVETRRGLEMNVDQKGGIRRPRRPGCRER